MNIRFVEVPFSDVLSFGETYEFFEDLLVDSYLSQHNYFGDEAVFLKSYVVDSVKVENVLVFRLEIEVENA